MERQLIFAVEIHGGLLKMGKRTQAVRVPVEEIEAYKRRTVCRGAGDNAGANPAASGGFAKVRALFAGAGLSAG
jgi:hypothetical protein